MKDSKKIKQHRDIFFNKLNSQKINEENKGYNDIYKPLTRNNRYILFSKLLHDTIQYENKLQKSLYKDKLEESPANKKQHLIKKNIIKDSLHNFNNLNIIILHSTAINKYYIKKTKKNLRYNKQITKLIIKIIKITEASITHTIIYIL